MKKQTLIHIHGLYSEALDFLEEEGSGDVCREGPEYDEYEEFGVRPTSIHQSKDKHKRAIQLMSRYMANFEGVDSINWDQSESSPEPDMDFGDVALYKSWEGNEHDRIEFDYSDAESVEVDISDSGKHRRKYEAMGYLAQGDSLDEAIQQTYSHTTKRSEPWNLLNEKVLDGDGRLPNPEEVNKVLEKVEE